MRCIARKPSASAGPHIKVRFFGGWDYNKDILNANDWVHQSYAKGVPMGADLPPLKGVAPTFVVWAVKDPTSANFDRIQIIKGWTKNGQTRKIFDVAWSGDRKPDKWSGRVPAIQSTVDLEKADLHQHRGFGGIEDCVDRSRIRLQPACVLLRSRAGNPDAALDPHPGGQGRPDSAGRRPAPQARSAPGSSPIWYTPSADARKNAPAGMTVTDLKAKGATQLGDAQLKALIVGKAFWVRNNATGEQFSVAYTAEGNSNVWHIGHNATIPSYVGNPVRNGYEGVTTPYKIEGGKVVTSTSQAPYSMTIYKLGDTYYGARSNEFGYANYEIIPSPQFVLNPLTATLNTLSIELGLNEQQKQQISPIPARRGKATGGAEEEHFAQALGEGRAVEANQQRYRCQDQSSSRSRPAEEVSGECATRSGGNDRANGKPGDSEGGSQGQGCDVGPEARVERRFAPRPRCNVFDMERNRK